jgi:hypothetical protein
MYKTFSILIFVAIFTAVGCASRYKVKSRQSKASSPQDNLPPRIEITNGPPELREYDEMFVNEVSKRWYELLDIQVSGNDYHGGKVLVRFRLHADGRATDTAVVTNTTGNIMLGLLCEKAILDPQPYSVWPQSMRDKLKQDYRAIDFSFYYTAQTNLPAAERRNYPRPSHPKLNN